MDDYTICEKCGSKMLSIDPLPYEDQLSTCGMKCPNCGWGWVTTYCPPILTEETVYEIGVLKQDPDISTIKAVSKAINCNLLQARDILINAPKIVYRGKALEVKGIKKIFTENDVKFFIAPDFPY